MITIDNTGFSECGNTLMPSRLESELFYYADEAEVLPKCDACNGRQELRYLEHTRENLCSDCAKYCRKRHFYN